MQSDGYRDPIIQSWMPFERLADFDEAVVENGDEIREDLDEVMDCGESALGGWFNYYMSENMENIKSGLISYQHCEINEGVGASKVVEFNNQEAAQVLRRIISTDYWPSWIAGSVTKFAGRLLKNLCFS